MLSAFTVSTLQKCAARGFGDPVLDGKAPSFGKHSATHVWFHLIFQCRILTAEGILERLEFHVDGRRICGGAFAAVYAIPPATFATLVRHVRRGDYAWVTYAGTRTCSKASDKPTLVMSAEVCVRAEVYKKEFVPQMRGIGYLWSLESEGWGSYATWREGRKRALFAPSKDTYGADYQRPFCLISRADHSAFKECPECKRLRLQIAELLKAGHESTAIRTVKEEQRHHSEWFMKQRRELDNIRHSRGRHDTLFEQACACRFLGSFL
eukprot:742686-Pleurochrysis_carterae.AAC.2